MNKRLRLAVRNAACTSCKLHTQADGDDICVTGQGPTDAKVGVVTKFPMSDKSRARKELGDYLTQVGIDPAKVMYLSALKCRVWDIDPGKTDMKACAPYLMAELDFLQLDHLLVLGGEALFAATGKSGIMKYRGKQFAVGQTNVFATISPSAVSRNPGQLGGFLADMQFFARLVKGGTSKDPDHVPGPDRTTRVNDKDGLKSLQEALKHATAVAYDIETNDSEPWSQGAAIVSIAFTTRASDGSKHVWELPLFHPESPWRQQWRRVIEIVMRWFGWVPIRIAHNAKFDSKWLRYITGLDSFPTDDTIIAASILDENRPKGLKPLAQQLLGADPWGIDTKNLMDTPLDEVMEYNGLDTWHTIRLWELFRAQLREQPRLRKLYQNLMMPAIQELIPIEQRGVYVDRQVFTDNWEVVRETLGEIEDKLWSFIPDNDEDMKDWPDRLFNMRTGELNVNWNASNFARWFLFEHLELPIMARGKTKENGNPGDPSMAEAVLMELAPMHPVAKLLLDRIEWNKFNTGFFTPYESQIDHNSRLHSTFKPWGTVTGRLSSGREDQEKVSGKKQTRGVNLQQVPRNKLVRGIFGAAPGFVFVEADYSQIELRIAAMLANERTMLHLYATGADIHLAMAMRMTGKPAGEITKEERKRAKAVNFGFLYGMGWRKFIQTAWSNYGLRVTEEEARAFRVAFFDQFPELVPWHARQRRLAHTYKRVETPFGRVRHLPDIDSPSKDVQAEAERQSINSPVQGMASDMALLSMVMLARQFRLNDTPAWPIGTVHDAVNFEVREDVVHEVLPVIKWQMENLPLDDLFGINLTVPIVADLKVGHHWGGASEVPAQLLSGKTPVKLKKWIKEAV